MEWMSIGWETPSRRLTAIPGWRSFSSVWKIGINGSRNQSTVKGFSGAGQETLHQTPFVLEADEPVVLLGRDSAPNPAEYVLQALASCLTTSLVYHAAARGIKIDEVQSKLEGDLDLHGFLGLSDEIRRGYQNVRVSFTVKSDSSAETLQELCKYSPVFDIVSNPVPVSISVERGQGWSLPNRS